MDIRFDGEAAIVTGAGAGLGRAHALLLARRGASVVVNDPGRTADGGSSAEAVAAEIVAAGGTAVPDTNSVADRAGAMAIVDTAVKAFGGIHVLVNNAGILRDRSFTKLSLDDFELVLQVHLLGTVYCTKAVWDVMGEQRYGRIVFTSSASGLVGSFGQSNYGTAKTGMLGLMNCLAIEGARRNVLVNSIAPVAATAMTAGLLDPELEPFLGPEHLAPLVAFLASKHCTTTGDTYTAGGGHYARLQVMKARGLQLDPGGEITPEAIATGFDTISDMAGAAPFRSIRTSLRAELVKLGRLPPAA